MPRHPWVAFVTLPQMAFQPPGCEWCRDRDRIPGEELAACYVSLHLKRRKLPLVISKDGGGPSWDSGAGASNAPPSPPTAIFSPTADTSFLVSLLWQENHIHSCDGEIQFRVTDSPPPPLSFKVLGVTWTSFLTPSLLNFLFRDILGYTSANLIVGTQIGRNDFRTCVTDTLSVCGGSSMLREGRGSWSLTFFWSVTSWQLGRRERDTKLLFPTLQKDGSIGVLSVVETTSFCKADQAVPPECISKGNKIEEGRAPCPHVHWSSFHYSQERGIS